MEISEVGQQNKTQKPIRKKIVRAVKRSIRDAMAKKREEHDRCDYVSDADQKTYAAFTGS